MKFIVKQGRKWVLIFAVLVAISAVFELFFCLFLFLFLLNLFIFRNIKPKPATIDPFAILMPITGKIRHISEGEFMGQKCTKVVIEKFLFFNGVVRAFSSANVINFKLKHGLSLCNHIKIAKILNSRVTYVFENKNFKSAMIIVAGSFAKNLSFENPHHVDTLDELGFLQNGLVELYLPRQTKIIVGINEKISQGKILGYFEKESLI